MDEQSVVQNNQTMALGCSSGKIDSVWQEQMVLEYAPLVRFIAIRLASRLPSHISEGDLINSGIIGLIDAIQKYDPNKNINFKTYAEFRIKGAMLDELRSLDWVPRSVRDKAHVIENAYAHLQKTMGRPAEAEEVAKHLGMELEDFYQFLNKNKAISIMSLETEGPRSTDDPESHHNLAGILRDENLQDSLQVLQLSDLREIIHQVIETMPDREKLLISLYYYEELTMKEIGEIMGYTESRISQLHTQAMIRLRSKLFEYSHEIIL